jgi:ureidoacrylate peracid hydrolase
VNQAPPGPPSQEPPDLTLLANPRHTAVLVVDVQRAFTDLFRPPCDPPREEVLPRMTTFLRQARAASVPVFIIRTVVPPEAHSRTTRPWPRQTQENLAPGAAGVEFDSCIDRAETDIEVVKPRYSGFIGTDLDEQLQTRGIETVVALGITTDVCVASSARDAWQHDYNTITLSDCCTAIAGGNHDAALQTLGRHFGFVCTSAEVMAAWQPQLTVER